MSADNGILQGRDMDGNPKPRRRRPLLVRQPQPIRVHDREAWSDGREWWGAALAFPDDAPRTCGYGTWRKGGVS